MTAIGLLGGTFDPIHVGHLDVARAAHRALSLDEVWLIPARHPPHRRDTVASPAHRFAMAALACGTEDWLRTCDVEMERPGPSFTIDTLERLESRHPDLRRRFVFVTGADAFRDIRTWHRWRELVDRCTFAVVSRPGHPAGRLRDELPDLSGRMHDAPCRQTASAAIILIDAQTTAVSSTRVRQALHTARSTKGLLPDMVAEYAWRHRLYAGPDAVEAPNG